MPKNDLWGPVLPGLDSFSKVFVGKACITHVNNLEKDLVVQVDSDAFPLQNQRIPYLVQFLLSFHFTLL